ncbi:PRTRC system protein C [Mucilaginibacter gilvus]|uniref:PRTRC system protein C n=1 Tax=Mucilaginibacter gilvus TaxID=2305909 RepID=A0A444MJB3_9SPHI|nr:PRTRC system protein C [Mucilaginibacter gilvus]RWY48337.1 PRTRC system protein C [Mucilaginibacter gilvus]
MLLTSILPRVFLHKENGQEVRLTDPNKKFSPEAVLNFYSGTYPILTTAKINGPEIKKDEIQYCFVSTIGTKG